MLNIYQLPIASLFDVYHHHYFHPRKFTEMKINGKRKFMPYMYVHWDIERMQRAHTVAKIQFSILLSAWGRWYSARVCYCVVLFAYTFRFQRYCNLRSVDRFSLQFGFWRFGEDMFIHWFFLIFRTLFAHHYNQTHVRFSTISSNHQHRNENSRIVFHEPVSPYRALSLTKMNVGKQLNDYLEPMLRKFIWMLHLIVVDIYSHPSDFGWSGIASVVINVM